MALTDTAALAADLQTHFARKLLVLARKDTVFRQFAFVEPLPNNNSLTISFTQYAKLPLVTTTLTQGVPPTSNTITNTGFSATVDQVGAFVEITDLAEMTVKHPVTQMAMTLLSAQAGESIDRRIYDVLVAGTQVQYAGAVANRAALGAANVMTMVEFRRAAKTLRANGAIPYAGNDFVMVVDPSVEADITTDSLFISVGQNHPEAIYANEVGRWFGIRVVRSNGIPTIASTTTVHTSFIFGQFAFAITDLQNLQMYVEGPGGVSDPLHQKRTLGWKVAFKAAITNNSFMLRIESGSAYN